MTNKGKTETVTKTGPTAPSTLHDGMPIADKRIRFGKGAGKWFLVFCAVIICAILLYVEGVV